MSNFLSDIWYDKPLPTPQSPQTLHTLQYGLLLLLKTKRSAHLLYLRSLNNLLNNSVKTKSCPSSGWKIIYRHCKFNGAVDLIHAANVLKKERKKRKCLSCLSPDEVLCLINDERNRCMIRLIVEGYELV